MLFWGGNFGGKMSDWTLINEYGDRIERIMKDPFKFTYSYWTHFRGANHSGHINKIKKIINDYRGKKTKWKEVWE